MGTKVKGFFKGLKNISNIFDEEKEEQEIQIGMPTDVKHVAHIGADGPAEESPSWMKEYDSGHNQSGPLDVDSGDSRGKKNHRATRSEELNREVSDMPKPPKQRHRSMDATLDPDSEGKDKDPSTTKPKRTRRHRLRRRSQEKGDEESQSPDTNLPDVPKKRTRRRKLRERDDDGSTKSMDSEASNN